MANKKITELNNITGADLVDADEFVVVDISADETKAITFGELKTSFDSPTGFVPTTGGTFTGDLGTTNVGLAAIVASKAVTAVDVFVYDTSKDSDGGAWRKRTQATSWYNETLNTATRGSRREFPAVAVIVAEAAKVTIYDGDDPALPMWRVEDYTGLTISPVVTINGQIWIGTSTGVIVSSYAGDDLGTTTLDYTTATTPAIVNNSVNDVAMTVLPNAPIDPATGLPVPTIAVATEGGLSVIKDDGTVVDITNSNATYTFSDNVSVNEYGSFTISLGADASHRWVYVFDAIPPADTVINYNNKTASGLAPVSFYTDTTNFNADFRPVANTAFAANNTKALLGDKRGTTLGLARFLVDKTAPTSALHSFTTSTYNTGWMNGNIKGAFLSDTDTADLVGGTDSDRSVNANPLTVNGTVTRSAVATGAELVAYSGFSTANYLEQPYNSDLDFGTGDFCVMGWVKPSALTFLRCILELNGGLRIVQNAGNLAAYSTALITSNLTLNTGVWQFISVRRSSGQIYFGLNGAEGTAVANTANVGQSGVMTIGYGTNPEWSGFLSLLRISATAPTAEQIAKIYNDEKVLFQENTACTIFGTSDAVIALAHDTDTDLLHVGTSAGRSVFQGLRRVSNTTTAVGTAISASNNLVVEE